MCGCMCPYYVTCLSHQPSFWKWAIYIWITSLGANHSIVQYMRLHQTHSSGLPYKYQTHIRCFTTFICCGCEYVWVLTTLCLILLPKLLLLDLIYSPRGKPQHSAVHEAINYFKWNPTSISNTHKMFHNLHMLWMWICMTSYHIMPDLVTHAFGS